MKAELQQTGFAIVKVDDNGQKYFECQTSGDMDSGKEPDVHFQAEHCSVGTKIIIHELVCPKCHYIQEECESVCDFDWSETNTEYHD